MGVAFIVEGDLEKLAIQQICGDAPIRKIGLNGKSARIEAIINNISTFLRLFKGRYFPVFIVLDRETREQSSEDLEQQIALNLKELGFDEEIIVTVPDRMIENWICAGTTHHCGEELTLLSSQKSLEGRKGKSWISRALDEIDVSYAETTVGVRMLKAIDVERACVNSASFARFHSKAAGYCLWLRRRSTSYT